MSKLSDNMILDEEELYAFCNDFNSAATEVNNKIRKYIEALKNVRNNAIKDGETAEALSTYIEAAKLLQNQIIVVSQNEKILVRKYISKVDTDDKYIY